MPNGLFLNGGAGGGGGGIGGSGTAGVIPKFSGATTLANSFLTTSGANGGTFTFFDSTAVTGVTALIVTAGAGQSTTDIAQFMPLSGIATSIKADGKLQGPGVRESFDRYFALDSAGLSLGGNSGARWGAADALGSYDLDIHRAELSATPYLIVGDASTGLRGIVAASLAVANSASATVPGTVAAKIEVFDETGASLGFVAVYDAIT